MKDTVTSPELWSEANNAYLAASLHWLRLRLQQLGMPGEVTGTAEVSVQKRPHWLGRHASGNAVAALPPALPSSLAARIADAAQARADSAQLEPPPALPALAERLGLSNFETDTLLLCAAMELDPSVPALIASAQGSHLPMAPATFALALRLFDEPAWDALAPQRPLRYLRLLEINQPGATALTAAALRADERIVNCIKGLNLLDERVAALVGPPQPPPLLSLSQRRCSEEILASLRVGEASGTLPVIQLLGQDRGSRLAVAAEVCQSLGRQLYRLSAESLPSQRGEIETLARLWQRESLLLPVALYLEADEVESGSEQQAALRNLLTQSAGLVFVGLREAPLSLAVLQWSTEVPLPTPAEQHQAWCEALPVELDDADRQSQAARLSGHFRLDLAQIDASASAAQTRGISVWEAARDLSLERLESLAQRLLPKAQWTDLVLADEALGLLQQIAAQVHERHRVYQDWGYAERMNRGLGISALFAGESGTGKTMAAEVIANELQLHLFRIDLSSVVSKYIGETEKNLRRLFDAAEQGGAILFFDEADALFGKRSEVKDSHDRYANIEINYLLQRMEAFSGLAILATNMKSSLDTAFMRRLRFVVNFQFPGPVERRRIWQNALPPGVPRAALDYDRLARFNLSGGNIHSIALNAAFSAAADSGEVDMPRLLGMVRIELRKLGKPINEGEFR